MSWFQILKYVIINIRLNLYKIILTKKWIEIQYKKFLSDYFF
jgi:hypothetical protein